MLDNGGIGESCQMNSHGWCGGTYNIRLGVAACADSFKCNCECHENGEYKRVYKIRTIVFFLWYILSILFLIYLYFMWK